LFLGSQISLSNLISFKQKRHLLAHLSFIKTSQQSMCIENQILENLDHLNQLPNSNKLDKPNYLFFYMILPTAEQTFTSVKEILQKQTRQAG